MHGKNLVSTRHSINVKFPFPESRGGEVGVRKG